MQSPGNIFIEESHGSLTLSSKKPGLTQDPSCLSFGQVVFPGNLLFGQAKKSVKNSQFWLL